MDLTVPTNFTVYMATMTYNNYMNKYYPNVMDQEAYDKDVADGCAKGINHYLSRGASGKKIRNNYDARMRATNLYIRFLEHKVVVLEHVAGRKK